MDLLELFKKSLLDKKASGSTVKNYLADIRKFLRWFEASFGREFLPSDLNRDTITLFEQTQGGSISLEEGDLAAQESETSARSFERYLSTLRKFASFLKSQNLIASNPFDEIKAVSAQIEAESDPWKVKEFKNYLYLGGASKVTIKNYMVDINAFCAWASHVLSVENLSDNVFSGIDQSLISSYKERLASVLHLSPTSINRKLSSIRKYLAFASEKGLIDSKKLQVSSYEDIKIVESISSGSLSLQDFKEEEEKSQPEVSKTQWSKIPPVRLLQKLLLPYALLEELIAAKLAFIIRGKRLAQKASQTTAPLAISSRKHSVRATTSPVLGITPPNLPKEMYAPHKISLTNLPFHKKLIHHARFTRPNWYKKYHSTSFSHYFHFAILIIYASVVGIIIYTNLFQDASSKKALAAPASPPRILSFQGRLTDNNDNPITTGTQIRFQIYSDPTATGAGNLLWQEVDYVSPDQDGIFSQLLGNGSTCSGQPLTPQSTPCAIPSSVFTDNSSLYLGITIESTPELTPRQRLATVAFAENSESLQGMLPITDVSAGQTNVVLALDTGGDLTIGGSASPTFAATGGQFELSGQTLLLSTTPGSNGNVNVVPDGLGKIDLKKPLINSSANGNIVPGGVEVDDKFGVLATESAVAAFVVNNNTTGGDIIAASSSGTTRFQLANNGDINFAAGASLDTLSTGTLSLGATRATTISIGRSGQGITLPGFTGQNGALYGTSGTGVLAQATTATPGLCLISGASNPAWGSCSAGGGGISWWTVSNGLLYPINSTLDFAVGGTATTAAKFAILNVNSGTPTASVSATGGFSSYLTGDGTLATTNRGNLTIGNSSTYNTTGNVLLNPNGTGFVGIGTTSPLATLNVVGNECIGDSTTNCGGLGNGQLRIRGAGGIVDLKATGAAIDLASSTTPLYINSNINQDVYINPGTSTGKLGVGTNSPLARFDVRGADGTSTIASISGTTNQAALQVDNSGTGNQIIASKSGKTVFIVDNNGNVTVGPNGSGKITSAIVDPYLVQNQYTSGNTTLTFQTMAASNGDFLFKNQSTDLIKIMQSGNIIPQQTNLDLGSSLNPFNNVYANNFITTGTVAGFWQRNSGTLAPLNVTDDLLLGATATRSAKFGFINVAGGTPTATISGTTTNSTTFLTGNGNLGTTNRQTLSLGGSSSGFVQVLNSSGTPFVTFDTVNSRLGVGIANPATDLNVSRFTSSAVALQLDNAGYSGEVTKLTNDFYGTGLTTKFTCGCDPLTTGFIYFSTGNGPTERVRILGQGSVGLGTSTPISELHVTRPLSFGATGKALVTFDQIENQDILTASSSGSTKLVLTNGGSLNLIGGQTSDIDTLTNTTLKIGATNATTLTLGRSGQGITLPGFTTNGGVFYANGSGVLAQTGAGSSSQCLLGGTTPSFGACQQSDLYWNQQNGALFPNNSTVDFFIGGQSTTSAKFAITNVNGSASPVATLSATTASGGNGNGISIDGSTSTIQSLKQNTLTFGGSTTGSIKFVDTFGNTSLNIRNNQTVAIGADADPGNWARLYLNGGFRADDDFRFQKASGTQYISRLNQAGSGGASGYDLTFQVRGDNIALFGAGGLIINNSADSNNYFQIKSSQQANSVYLTGNTGNLGLGTNTPTSQLYVTRPLASGANGKALAVFDQIENQDILTASSSGNTRLTLNNAGQLALTNQGSTGGLLLGGDASLYRSAANTLHTASKFEVGDNYINVYRTGAAWVFAAQEIGDSVSRFDIYSDGHIDWGSGTGAVDTNLYRSAANTLKTDDNFIAAGSTIQFSAFTTNGGVFYADGSGNLGQTTTGSGGQCLQSAGGGAPTWGSCGSSGTNYWQLNNGLLSPGNSTVDFGIGGTSTSAAKFAITNVNGSASPVASLSATTSSGGTGAGLVLDSSNSSIQSLLNNTLTVGGGSTGDIQFKPGNSSTSLYLTSAGNVGIGNNAPSPYKFFVNGTSWLNGNTTVFGSVTATVFYDYTSGAYYLDPANTTTSLVVAGKAMFGTTTGNSQLYVTRALSTGATGKALAIFDQIENQDILTASSGGTTKFQLTNNGSINIAANQTIDTLTNGTLEIGTTNATTLTLGRSGQGITLPGFTAQNGVLYGTSGTGVLAQATTPTSGLCLTSGGSNPTWATCPGTSTDVFWTQANGTVYPTNTGVDLLVGGSATTSAKFGLINVLTGTPTATISGTVAGANTFLTGNGNLGTTNNQSITIGGAGTGNIAISPLNGGAGSALTVNALTTNLTGTTTLNASSLATFNTASTLAVNTATLNATSLSALNTASTLAINTSTLTASSLSTFTTAASLSMGSTSTLTLASNATINGGTAANDDLTLQGTTNGTRTTSYVNLQPNGGSVGIGTATPGQVLDVVTNANNQQNIRITNSSNGSSAQARLNVVNDLGGSGAALFLASSGWASPYTNAVGFWNYLNGPMAFATNNAERGRFSETGNFGLGTTAPTSELYVTRALSAGANGKALAVFDQIENQDILTASSSGSTKLVLTNAGVLKLVGGQTSDFDTLTATTLNIGATNATTISLGRTGQGIKLPAFTTNGGVFYGDGSGNLGQTTAGLGGQCLQSNGGGAPTWGSCSAGGGTNWWNMSAGLLYPINSTLDFAIGGTSTASAKFAITNVNGALSPIATLSATTSSGGNGAGLALDSSNSSIQSLNFGTLNIGGATTGNIVIDSGSNVITLADSTSITGNLSLSGTTGITETGNGAGLSFSGTGNHDISAAAGTLRIGSVTLNGTTTTSFTGNNAVVFGTVSTGVLASATSSIANQCLVSGAGGTNTPGWATCASGQDAYWNQLNGALFPHNSTVDLLIGGQATNSAKFAITNVNGSASPVATLSATTTSGGNGNGISLDGSTSTLQSLRKNTLTLGGDTTGSVNITSGTNSGFYLGNNGNVSIGLAAPTTSELYLYRNDGTVNFKMFDDFYNNTTDLNTDYSGTQLALTPGGGGDKALRLSTSSIDRFIVLDSGEISIGGSSFTNPYAQLDVTRPLSWGATGKSLAIFNQIENQDILTASAGGTTRFRLANDGSLVIRGGQTSDIDTLSGTTLNIGASTATTISLGRSGQGITLPAFTTAGGIFFANGSGNLAQTTAGAGGQCLQSAGGGTPTWGTCGGGATNYWQLNGPVLSPGNLTVDLAIGGTTTSSAKFAITNVAGALSPIATLSATTASGGNGAGIAIDTSNNSIQSLNFGTLNIGGATTGNIILNPRNGLGSVGINNSNPTQMLSVGTSGGSGTIGTSVYYDIDNTTYFLDPAATGNALVIAGNQVMSNGKWLGLGASAGRIQFDDLTTDQVSFFSSNVGIGTDALPINNVLTSRFQVFSDLGTTPAASISAKNSTGPALLVTNDGPGDLFAASKSGSINFVVRNNGDIIVGPSGTGKITNATSDPLYTIDGNRYSTYGSSMIGVKEEITGNVSTSYNPSAGGYAYTIDFNSFNKDTTTDLWVFSRVIDPDINLIDILTTANSQAKTWYRKDPVNRKITFYSDRPTEISYRLTAPRFDHALHGTVSDEKEVSGLIAPPPPSPVGTGTADGQDSFLASLSIQAYNGSYRLVDSFGNAIYKIEAFSNLTAANIKAGIVDTQKLTTNSLNVTGDSVSVAGISLHDYVASIVNNVMSEGSYIANGQKIVSPLASIDQIHTNMISPLGGNEVAVKGTLAIKNNNNETVAAIDDQGNASFSGTLTANDATISGSLAADNASISGNLASDTLNTHDATVSGTLYANNIEANSITGLDAKIQNLLSNQGSIASLSAQNISAYQSQLASSSGTLDIASLINGQQQLITGHMLDIENLSADFGTFRQGLVALGPATFGQVTALDSFSIGTSLNIGPNSIDTLGQDLNINPLKQGAVDFLAGAVRIETDGTLKVAGNAEIAGNLKVKGNLAAGMISPLSGDDLKVDLPNDSSLTVKGASNSAVLAVNNQGNIVASGSGTFNKLNLSLADQAYATSDTEAVATGSAGTATLKEYRSELTITNPNVTAKSLIYITPVGNTNNKVLYLLRQVPGTSFTVGINTPSTVSDIKFNWIIVN